MREGRGEKLLEGFDALRPVRWEDPKKYTDVYIFAFCFSV